MVATVTAGSGFKVENSILLHLSDDLGMTLSRLKHAALGPKKTNSSQETTAFEGQSREFLIRTERTLIKKICKVCSTWKQGSSHKTCSHSPA